MAMIRRYFNEDKTPSVATNGASQPPLTGGLFQRTLITALILLGIISPSAICNASSEYAPEDLYLQIYQKNQQDTNAKTLKRVSQQAGLPQKDVADALNGVYSKRFLQLCREYEKETNQQEVSTWSCANRLQENYDYEKNLATLEDTLTQTAEASEIWTDGDLSNSFFDVMADFNTLEIILFGKNTYKYPFKPYRKGGNQQGGGAVGGGVTNTGCVDPEALILTGTTNSGSTANTAQGNEYNFTAGSPESCNGQSILKGLVCLPPWPCGGLFCIKIKTTPQKPSSSGGKGTSIQEIVDLANSHLTYLKGYNLTVYRNSNERFIISVGKFLSRFFNLDVITQGIPVKFSPEESSQFDDPDEKATDTDDNTLLSRLRTNEDKASMCLREENDDLICDENSEATLNLRIGTDTTQQDTYAKLNQEKDDLAKMLTKARQEFLETHQTKYAQGEWDDLRSQLNLMSKYFQAMAETLYDLTGEGKEILDDAKRSCNSKK